MKFNCFLNDKFKQSSIYNKSRAIALFWRLKMVDFFVCYKKTKQIYHSENLSKHQYIPSIHHHHSTSGDDWSDSCTSPVVAPPLFFTKLSIHSICGFISKTYYLVVCSILVPNTRIWYIICCCHLLARPYFRHGNSQDLAWGGPWRTTDIASKWQHQTIKWIRVLGTKIEQTTKQ